MDGYSWSGEGAEEDIDRILRNLGDAPKRQPEDSAPPDLRHLDHEVRTTQFWDSLNPAQLHHVRTMMLAIAGAGERMDGQVLYHVGYADSLLRSKFGLCPRCMNSHGTGECFEEVMSSNRHYRAACNEYNVTPEAPDSSNFSIGPVACRDCGAVYDSLAERMVASGEPACPGCTKATAAKRT